MVHRKTLFATLFAAVMVVSMFAPTAGAAAAMDATGGDAVDAGIADVDADVQPQTTTETNETQSASTGDETRVVEEVPASEATGEVSGSLRDASGETTLIVSVERTVDVPRLAAMDDASALDELKADARATQAPVIDALETGFDAEVRNSFWAGNVVSVDVDLDENDIEEIASIDGVSSVSPNVQYERPEPPATGSDADATPADHDGEYTYGLEQINVPEFEDEFGVRGEGATVMIGDDGISNPEEGHPDLEFAKEAIAENGTVEEGTLVGGNAGAHGEHTAGTATGAAHPAGDVPRYGVAPEADLLMADVFAGGAYTEDIIASMQWAAENDADAASFSLGLPSETGRSTFSLQYADAIEDVNAAGTAAVVSAGNSGSGDSGGPVSAPATSFSSVAVAASTEAGDIATFSSGAVIDENSIEGDETLPDWFPRQYVQPDVAAPGNEVLSSGPLGGDIGDANATYSYASGTSMAAPHYTGAIALLQSYTDEDLDAAVLESALAETAEKPENDFTELNGRDIRYGTGIIDVYAAAQALDERQTIEGTVTDADGDPVVGATVETAAGALTATDENGTYSLPTTTEPAQLTVDAFGYESETLNVSGGETTDVQLDDELVVDLVEGQPPAVEQGGSFDVVVEVANLDRLTVAPADDATVDPDDLTLSVGGDEVPIGEPIETDGLTGTVTLNVSVADDADLESTVALEHTFERLPEDPDDPDDPDAEATVSFEDGLVFDVGETRSVALSTDAADVAGYQATVDFDPDALQVVSVSGGEVGNSLISSYDNENGTISLADAQSEGVDQPTLANVEFTFVGDEGDETDLEVADNGTTVSAADGDLQTVGETVTWSAGIPGDVNDDGAVTPFDAVLTQQFIADQEPNGEFYESLADVDDSGTVTTTDVVLILEQLVGVDESAATVLSNAQGVDAVAETTADGDVAPADGHDDGEQIVVETGPTEVVDELGPAEFEVENVETPESVTTDEPILVEATVTNVGQQSGQTQTITAIQDAATGGNDTFVYFPPSTVTLDPGESTTLQTEFPSIEGLNAALGDVDLGPGDELEGVQQVGENLNPDEGPDPVIDDEGTSAFTVTGEEFTVSDLAAPAEAEPGAAIDVNATITNDGNANGTQAVEFAFAGETVASQNVTLGAGASESVGFENVTLPSEPGEYEHGIFTEDDGQTATIVVGDPADGPTFTVSDLSAPAEAEPGAAIDVNATVTNDGDANGTQVVEFVFNDSVVASQNVTLGAGASESVGFENVTLPSEPGEYEHGIFTEDDNQTATIVVGDPAEAEFEVTGFDVSPSNATLNDSLTVDAEVTNVGDANGTVDNVVEVTGPGFQGSIVFSPPESDEFTAGPLAPNESATLQVNLGTLQSIDDIDGVSIQPGDEVAFTHVAGQDVNPLYPPDPAIDDTASTTVTVVEDDGGESADASGDPAEPEVAQAVADGPASLGAATALA